MISATCDDIDIERPLELAFDPVPEPMDPILMEYVSRTTIPESASIRAAGGIACEWARPDLSQYVGVALRVLPDVSAEWWAFAETTGIGEYNDWCYDGLAHCGTQSLVRGMWVDATAQGGDVQEAAVALTNTLAYSVELTEVSGTRWLGSEGERRTCDDMLTDDVASAVLARQAEVYVFDSGKSIAFAAERLAGVSSCGVNERSAVLGTVSVLPGGAWAWESVQDQLIEEAVTIAGADAATIRCSPADDGCVVDLVLGGDWIRVGVLPEAGDPRAGAIALAGAISSRG